LGKRPAALTLALQQRQITVGFLHHSDRGSQYMALDYQEQLVKEGMRCSMSRPGNCWNNAVVESFFATLKTELIHRHRVQTKQKAQSALFADVEGFYNTRRRHSTLDYLSPVEFERQSHLADKSVH
jgi:transposase InsO family protein